MSLEDRGDFVVGWLERGGRRFLKESQPDKYEALLLHVGATDRLKQYTNSHRYWQYVQAMLDFFFSSAERAELCAELLKKPMFREETGIAPFLQEARAEVSCSALIAMIEGTSGIPASLRSVR